MGHWVLTGCAGFIGSHLLGRVLKDGRTVVGVDDLSSGTVENLESVRREVGENAWSRFRFLNNDIRDPATAEEAMQGAELVIHNAAVGSVPRSLREPDLFHAVNVGGTHFLLEAARRHKVRRFVYASSSSVYGDHPKLPKVEREIGEPLSPYAATKRMNEVEAGTYRRCYDMETIGLRYFNVFGSRQNPNGPYAAVIPKWIANLGDGKDVEIFGDGTNSRDFCFIENVVEANLLAATTSDARAFGSVFNIACGDRTNLKELAETMLGIFRDRGLAQVASIRHLPPREGDIPHSLADVSRACDVLGYSVKVRLGEGLEKTIRAYLDD